MLALESECDSICETDDVIWHYQAFNNDPVNNVDPSGLAATRTYLAGSDTTNFHTTKEIVVLPDGSRQATYRLFLSRTDISSAGVGAPGYVSRSETEITHATQAFAGARAPQLEALVDKTVASRVDSLNQIDAANATVDNMKMGFGLIPFFSAVDQYRRGEPWKLDAALSALALAPAIGSAIKSFGAMAAESSALADAAESAAAARKLPTPTLTDALSAGEGATDKFGNMTVSSAGTQLQQDQALLHEQVHSFLSPVQGSVLAIPRADFRMWLYQNSTLMRFSEETLAESRAQLLTRNMTGLNTFQAVGNGLSFPFNGAYGISPARLAAEGAGAAAATGTAIYGAHKVGEKLAGE
jgi:hypothetical protein